MYKFFGKNKRFYACASKMGRNAYKVSNVWKLGFHVFHTSDGSKTFRLVYFRSKKHTYYCEISIARNNYNECCN